MRIFPTYDQVGMDFPGILFVTERVLVNESGTFFSSSLLVQYKSKSASSEQVEERDAGGLQVGKDSSTLTAPLYRLRFFSLDHGFAPQPLGVEVER
jgi:hypothetical protein